MLRVNGFFGHIQKNHWRSLMVFIGFAVAFQIAAGVLLTVPIIASGSTNFIFVAPLAYLKIYGLWVFIAGGVLFILTYLFQTKLLQHGMGFEVVTPMMRPRLCAIVENYATTAGIKMPDIAIMPHSALNSFACGLSKNNATIVVTEGLLRGLNDDELAAVIAHEVAHIKNGDVNFMAVANAAMSIIGFINKINPFQFRGKKSLGCAILLPPVLMLFLFFGFAISITNTLTKITRYLITSSREYIADAEAVRLTHNPGALISALRKIEGRSAIDDLSPAAEPMMIDGDMEGAMATHPAIYDRIAMLTSLSGSMIHGAAPHRDTRPEQYREAPQPMFGLPPQSQPSVQSARPSKSLINRVNAGSDKNAFGLKKGWGRIIIYGMIGMFFFTRFASGEFYFRGFNEPDKPIPAISSELPSLRGSHSTDERTQK